MPVYGDLSDSWSTGRNTMQGHMLPPVSEALGLLDVCFINNDGQSTPAATRRAFQILVDHIQVQNAQLQRVEDILAAFGNPSQQSGTIWTKLAAKADLSRVEQLEAQVDIAQEDASQAKQKQAEASKRYAEAMQQLASLQEQMSALEARVGGGSNSFPPGVGAHLSLSVAPSPSGVPHQQASPSAAHARPRTAGQPAGSLADRLQKLERRADMLSAGNYKNQEDVSDALGRLRELEPRLDGQLAALRTDIKQALVLATSNCREAAEAEAAARTKELEKRVLSRVHNLEESVETRIGCVATKVGVGITQELDTRFTALYDHVDMKAATLHSDVERSLREKVDVNSLDAYTSRVSRSFEQVAGSLGDEVKRTSDTCNSQLSVIRNEVAAVLAGKADKALESSVADQNQVLQQLTLQVADLAAELDQHVTGLTAALTQQGSQLREEAEVQQAGVRGLIKELQAGLGQVSDQADHLTKSVGGLNSAVTNMSGAMELQAHKLSALGHRLQAGLNDVAGVKEALYGPVAHAASAALENVGLALGPATSHTPGGQGGSSGAGNPCCISARLAGLERTLTEQGAALASKVDENIVRDISRSLGAVQRQAEHASEGLRSLTQTTYKRADEAASAIQKLSLALNSHMEDRPTVSAVRNMLESSGLEVGEKLATALLPIWEAVKALQSGMRDAGSELRDLAAHLPALRQQHADLRSHVSDTNSVMASLVACAVEQQVASALHAQGSGLATRLAAAEGELGCIRGAVELVSAVQDKHQQLMAAIEDQLSVQQSSVKAGTAAVLSELGNRLDTAVAALDARATNSEATVRQLVANTKEIVGQLSQRPVLDEVRQVAGLTARHEVSAQADKELERWQVWVELQEQQLSLLAPRAEVDAAVQAAVGVAKQAAHAAEVAAGSAARQTAERLVAGLRDEVESRVQAADGRVSAVSGRLEVLEHALVTRAAQQDLLQLGSALSSKADQQTLEAGMRAVQDEAARQVLVLRHSLEAELARKLDVKTFLASSSSSAAIAAATAAAPGLSASPSSNKHSSLANIDVVRSLTGPALQQQEGSPKGAGARQVTGVGSIAAREALARLGEKLRNSTNSRPERVLH